MRLQDKIAIVTGSSSGIGEETAKLFAREGATVVLTARSKDKLAKVEEAILAAGGKCAVIPADITSETDCRRLVEETVKAYGRIDILVNNAGIADKHMPITKCSTEWWDEVILTDQTSVFYLTKAVLEHMKKGSIVNVSSIGGVFGSAGISYSAAKSALLGMTKNIAIQFAGQGIRCNAVCPGPTPPPSTPRKNWPPSTNSPLNAPNT